MTFPARDMHHNDELCSFEVLPDRVRLTQANNQWFGLNWGYMIDLLIKLRLTLTVSQFVELQIKTN